MVLLKKPVHPTLIPIISVPAFLFAGLLSGLNWVNLGQRHKGMNTIRNSLLGTGFIIVLMLLTPRDTVIKLWPVWLGINLGVGMALRKLQLPAYETWKSE